MINVAFLLLVFFLMTAVLTPVGPLEITVPTAEGKAENAGDVILLGADGTLARGSLRGAAVFDGLEGRRVQIRADAAASGSVLAQVISQLAASGVEDLRLVTAGR